MAFFERYYIDDSECHREKLNDYYGLTEYHIHIDNSPAKFGWLSYTGNDENTRYFNSVFENTKDLFGFDF